MVQLSSLAAALAVGLLPHLAVAAGLHEAAVAKGKLYFGTATDNGELSDSPYFKQLGNTADFGQITPSNSMKWESNEPSQNSFSFAGGDAIADLAETNGQKLRCHTLVWHSQLPNWVSSGTWTNETLLAAMKNHITKVATHYKGRCYAWDVVNEALNEDGTYRDSPFLEHIGEAFLPIAFATAAAADPTAKLYYNDYNIESPGAKATAAAKIVKLIQSYGVKIDGVGMQAHFIVGSSPSESALSSTLSSYTSLGVEAAYTELDIRLQLPSTDAQLAQQSTDYQAVAAACVKNTDCVGITIWDWTDKYSWVPGVFSGYGDACPWDENLTKKPAYSGLMAGLGGGGSSTTTTAGTTMTTTTSSAAPTSTGEAQKWGQCGGLHWTGPTVCVSGTTCQKQNDYYSQCL
ncbi:putative endo-1,4-beta-xylanase [Aspergillus candidus]|uniref:Beta-xylanase n=1 Tax=Aspergillus candidus TaxID=41067 RepID=A0A2I2F2S3_ASPCN|nr:endo-1,4-beta-xylanase precursor [Aspergillus candidus]PLB34933.1 endo-1,4-beta-xylanase precursor [Aspergillus candidus]